MHLMSLKKWTPSDEFTKVNPVWVPPTLHSPTFADCCVWTPQFSLTSLRIWKISLPIHLLQVHFNHIQASSVTLLWTFYCFQWTVQNACLKLLVVRKDFLFLRWDPALFWLFNLSTLCSLAAFSWVLTFCVLGMLWRGKELNFALVNQKHNFPGEWELIMGFL